MQPPRAVSPSEIETHRHLVTAIVNRMARKIPAGAVPREDLEAAGMGGLLDALQKKAARPDDSFEWYARVRIRGAVIDELRRRDWASRGARRQIREDRDADAGEGAGAFVIPLDPEALARLPALASGTACPLEGIARRREQGALARAVARLPEREARITRMHYFDEVPLREIAAHLMVTPARVSQLHSRALKTLRALLVADAAVA